MTESDSNLASRLLNLPLDLEEKVFLWLSYKGLKPVSEITIKRRNFALLRKGIGTDLSEVDIRKVKIIKNWINDAGMFYGFDPKYPDSWHVGKNKTEVELSIKTIREFSYESELQTGLLLGYPKKSVEAYAHNRVSKLKSDQISMVWYGDLFSNSYLGNKYYLPYVCYSIRFDCLEQDSNVAKKWADIIRKEVPLLAKWYEKYKTAQMRHDGKFVHL